MAREIEASFPDDANGDVLRRMALDGCELTSPRVVDFEHCFPDEATARRFQAAVAAEADRTLLFAPDEETGRAWEVQCKARVVPTHSVITELEKRFAELGESFGGYADGWGSLSNPDGSPAE